MQDPRVPQKPVSPNLSRALQNQNVRTASYTLPDGTIIDPRQQVIHDSLFLYLILICFLSFYYTNFFSLPSAVKHLGKMYSFFYWSPLSGHLATHFPKPGQGLK